MLAAAPDRPGRRAAPDREGGTGGQLRPSSGHRHRARAEGAGGDVVTLNALDSPEAACAKDGSHGVSLAYGSPLRGFPRDLPRTRMGARGGQEELWNPGLTLATGGGNIRAVIVPGRSATCPSGCFIGGGPQGAGGVAARSGGGRRVSAGKFEPRRREPVQVAGWAARPRGRGLLSEPAHRPEHRRRLRPHRVQERSSIPLARRAIRSGDPPGRCRLPRSH